MFHIENCGGANLPIGFPIGWQLPNDKELRFRFVERRPKTVEKMSLSSISVSLTISQLHLSKSTFWKKILSTSALVGELSFFLNHDLASFFAITVTYAFTTTSTCNSTCNPFFAVTYLLYFKFYFVVAYSSAALLVIIPNLPYIFSEP